MSRDFNAWLSGFRDSIADYGYYIDFEKVHRNVDNIKVELNILNSLIGSKNIEADFENLISKIPNNDFSALGSLITTNNFTIKTQ